MILKPRLVVLNKIDTLWDALSSSSQVHAQIERLQLDRDHFALFVADRELAHVADELGFARVFQKTLEVAVFLLAVGVGD